MGPVGPLLAAQETWGSKAPKAPQSLDSLLQPFSFWLQLPHLCSGTKGGHHLSAEC